LNVLYGYSTATAAAIASSQAIGRLKAEPGADDNQCTVTNPVNRPGLDASGMETRMDAIRLKQMLGGVLTEQEQMCLQIEQNGFGCGNCSSSDARR
jgi:hypothetical protein